MPYTKIQSQSFLGFSVFMLPYMGMTAILFNGVEAFEQIINIPSTEDSM